MLSTCVCGHKFTKDEYHRREACNRRTGRRAVVFFVDCKRCGRSLVAKTSQSIGVEEGLVIGRTRVKKEEGKW